MRRLLTSAYYSGGTGENIGPFPFQTGACQSCTDLGNTGSFPDNRVSVTFQRDGYGSCTASYTLDGVFAGTLSGTFNSIPQIMRLTPGRHVLQITSASSSCRIGSSSSDASLAVIINGSTVASISAVLQHSDDFYVPAISMDNTP